MSQKQSLRTSETTWAIRARIEELAPQQLFLMEALVERCGYTHAGAKVFVKTIRSDLVSVLKTALEQAQQPLTALAEFLKQVVAKT